MKSKLDQQIEDTFYYAVNFYNTNDRSLEKQQFCLTEMQKYGLDLDTCIRIQNPIMSVFQMGELMQIGSEITQQHLATITHNIHKHLLSIQPTMQPEVVQELPYIPTLGGAGQGSNTRDFDGVNVQVKNIVQDLTINGYQGQESLIMSNYDLEPHDMNYLSATTPSNTYNFTLVDFSYNPRVCAMGVDYLLKGAAGISSIQQGNQNINLMYQGMLTRPSFNIVKLNLENCNIGDIGADIICHALANGKLPATKEIDVSGNNIGDKGEDFFVKVLNDPIVQHIAILIEDLKHNLKLQSAKKEHIVPELNNILQKAEKRGVDVKNMVVDLGFLNSIKNLTGTTKIAVRGFVKCKWTDDPIGDWAKTSLASKLPKKVAKFIDKAIDTEGTISCYIKAFDQAATSEYGAQMALNELYVIGENYVPENIE